MCIRDSLEDGILLPEYRLPTEAEWEYAGLSLIGLQATSKDELITDRRIYPWNGNTVRYQKRNKYQGAMLANFKRSGGDYGGMAGALNGSGRMIWREHGRNVPSRRRRRRGGPSSPS